jgi:hypothetical protein
LFLKSTLTIICQYIPEWSTLAGFGFKRKYK